MGSVEIIGLNKNPPLGYFTVPFEKISILDLS